MFPSEVSKGRAAGAPHKHLFPPHTFTHTKPTCVLVSQVLARCYISDEDVAQIVARMSVKDRLEQREDDPQEAEEETETEAEEGGEEEQEDESADLDLSEEEDAEDTGGEEIFQRFVKAQVCVRVCGCGCVCVCGCVVWVVVCFWVWVGMSVGL